MLKPYPNRTTLKSQPLETLKLHAPDDLIMSSPLALNFWIMFESTNAQSVQKKSAWATISITVTVERNPSFNNGTKMWDNFILINSKLHLDKRMFSARSKLYL